MLDAVHTSPARPGRLAPLQAPLSSSASRPADTASTATTRQTDSLELSPATTGIRTALVARVRSEIEAGTYLTEAKLTAAADRLLPDLDPNA